MKTQIKRPDKLLMVPVIIWAFTFTFGTVWMFILMNTEKDKFIGDLLLHTLLPVIAVNIAVLIILFISSYYQEQFRQELFSRAYLMLSNMAVAALYFIMMCQFSKFLN
jgi:hypothetical protein